jgi:fanconi anemia group J protein
MCESRSFITSKALPPVWDMEDLVTLSKKTKGCGYYASREQQQKAHIIFCPYNYLIDPMIRKAMDVELEGKRR